MTVQELINELSLVEDKNIDVVFSLNYTLWNIEKDSESFGIIGEGDKEMFLIGQIGDI